MSEAEKIDRMERRRRAEARLARSRPAREAAAAVHARRMSGRASEASDEASDQDRPSALSRLEAKVLDAANDILASRGEQGRRIAELIRSFMETRIGP